MPEEQLQDNPIFKFMKSNNLTKLDEKSFLDKYSTPEKAKEIHGFMLANKLTDLDETKFYDKYLSSGLKKKEQEVSQYVSSPTPSQSVSPDLEKGKAFAEKGFLMKGEGTKEQKRISLEPSLFGGAPNIKVLQEGEEPSALADISGAVAKGLLQGKVANILSAGKRPTEDELGEIAQLQSDAQLFPQSKSEKVYQEKGLKGLFKENPLLGAQFVAETMASSLSSLIEASKKTVPAAVIAGAGVGAPTGVGAMVGAGYGLLAGQSAAGYNLSTSQDILNSLSENGVDVSDKASLIKAFSDENKMAKIRNTAAKYGVPILIFDAATAGLAGKLGAGAIGKSLSKKLLAGLGETGIQIAGGMGGELSGQLASGKKVNWDDIVMEGLAEVPGGISEVATGIAIERSKSSSNNKTLATQIATQGVQNGTEDAIVNLNRDLSNNVITPKQYQEGLSFVEKAFQVYDKIPETVTGENRVKSIELLVERNDIKQANENLIQQKQASDEAYHAGIDEEIKANEERIKKIDSEVYDITKKPEKGTKKYTVDGKEVSQEEFDALQDKPIGTKTLAEPTEIGGLKVIKRAQDAPNGEAVYEVEGERFLTADGKELKVAKVELPKEEVKPIEIKETIKIKENAIQKPSTREVLQRPQEGVRETGGERKRVEPSIKGEAVTKEGKQVKVNEEKVLSSKGLKSAETRKINEEANKIEATDVRSAALKYLANAKLSWSAIDEVAGRVERAKLNTGERELKSAEARSRDYVAKKGEGESLDKAAHDIWESLSENIPDLDTRDVKNALMDAIREHSSKSEAAKALIEGYKEVDIDEQLNKYYERLAEDNPEAMDAEMAKLEESMSNLEEDDNYEFDYPEEHINNLKSQYEKESETKAEQPTKGSERKGDEKVSGRKGGENVKAEEGLAKEFKEATAKASKKAKENAKKEFVERNFDNIVEKLKIQIKCPT